MTHETYLHRLYLITTTFSPMKRLSSRLEQTVSVYLHLPSFSNVADADKCFFSTQIFTYLFKSIATQNKHTAR